MSPVKLEPIEEIKKVDSPKIETKVEPEEPKKGLSHIRLRMV